MSSASKSGASSPCFAPDILTKKLNAKYATIAMEIRYKNRFFMLYYSFRIVIGHRQNSRFLKNICLLNYKLIFFIQTQSVTLNEMKESSSMIRHLMGVDIMFLYEVFVFNLKLIIHIPHNLPRFKVNFDK